VIFSAGEDDRILRAADHLDEGIAQPILIGRPGSYGGAPAPGLRFRPGIDAA
jgi:phosphotransacetylase